MEMMAILMITPSKYHLLCRASMIYDGLWQGIYDTVKCHDDTVSFTRSIYDRRSVTP